MYTAHSSISESSQIKVNGHRRHEEMHSLEGSMEGDMREPIAVVGFSFKFPEEVTASDAFWKMLVEGRCAAKEIPKDRMSVDAFYHPGRNGYDTINARGGHFLRDNIAAFDAPFFSVSPAEAATMDPQQRGLLETTYRAMENAGLTMEDVSGSKTSVYTGCFTDDYRLMYSKDPERFSQYGGTGVSASLLANRLSWFFNFTGTSANVDSACSSSLVALDLACQSLISGESNMSVVAGCNLIFSPDMMLLLSNLNMLSADGRSYSFDHRANGYARGEGFSVVLIKRLSDAIQNGDTIRAVIRSTGSNQDGRTALGITRSSQKAQEALIRETYEKAKLRMEPTKFVESHGTATRVGDPIELNAIGAAFRKSRKANECLYVGAVKTNIGHLEGGSGLASLIKTILILERGLIPPNSNFQRANARINEEFMRVKFPLEPTPWPETGLRRASVNSFGFGGSNVHVVLDDAYHFLQSRGIAGNSNTVAYPPSLEQIASTSKKAHFHALPNDSLPKSVAIAHNSGRLRLLVLSALDEAGLERLATVYSQYFDRSSFSLKLDQTNDYLESLAYTLSHRRTSLPWKSYLTLDSLTDLHDLRAKLSRPMCSSLKQPRLGFIFTGQGAQWARMGQELLDYSVFNQSLHAAGRFLQSLGCPWLLLDELLKSDAESKIHEPDFSQPSCTAVQVALIDLLHSWGITASVVVGHSSGEIAAGYCIGAISKRSAWRLAYYRGVQAGILSRSACLQGGMLAVGLSEFQIQPYLKQLAQQFGRSGLTIGCFNSQRNLTISGDKDQIDALESVLSSLEKPCLVQKLKVGVAYHSPHMNTISEHYLSSIHDLERGDALCSQTAFMISTVTGQRVSVSELQTSDYWVSNMVSPVKFCDALSLLCTPPAKTTRIKIDRSHRKTSFVDMLLEVGPHSALKGPAREVLQACSNTGQTSYMSLLVRHSSASMTALDAAGNLHCLGYPVNFTRINHPDPSSNHLRALPDLPGYPFDHSKEYWCESRISKGLRFGAYPKHELLGKPVADWNPLDARWRNFVKTSEMPWVEDHKIQNLVLYPAAGMLTMAIEAMNQVADKTRVVSGIRIREAVFQSALKIPTIDAVETQLSLRPIHQQESFDRNASWSEFRLCSYENEQWIENCHGQIRAEYHDDPTEVDNGRKAREELIYHQRVGQNAVQSCIHPVDTTQLYQGLKACGYDYGSTFQPLEKISVCSNEAVAQVNLFRNRANRQDIYDQHVIHLTTLDGLMHLILAALTKGGSKPIATTIPTRIRSLWISSVGLGHTGDESINPGFAKATAQFYSNGFLGLESDLSVLDQTGGRLCAKMEGLQWKTVASSAASNTVPSHSLQTHRNVAWRPDIRLLDNQQLLALCKSDSLHSAEPVEFFHNLDLLLYLFIAKTLHHIESGTHLELSPHIEKYVGWIRLQNQLYDSGDLPNSLPQWRNLLGDTDYFNSLCKIVEEANDIGKLFVAVGKNMSQLINGEIDPLTLFFKQDLLSNAYKELNRKANYFRGLDRYLDILTHMNPGMKILEVGAGTGGTTFSILNILASIGSVKSQSARYGQYDFTDISPAFFEKAQDIFKDFPRIQFKSLNVEIDPEGQGFETGSYDMIVASLVLHATKDLNNTVQHVRSLLKPGGKLILLETAKPEILRSGFAMGLLPGWWLGAEDFRIWSPCVSAPRWDHILSSNGFSGTDVVFRDYESDVCHEMSIIVSTAIVLSEKAESGPKVIVIGENDAVEGCERMFGLKKKMESAGILVQRVVSLHEAALNSHSEETVYISMLELERPFLRDISPGDFKSLQTLLQSAKGVLWVSQGGGSGNPDFAMVDGLSRVMRGENNKSVFVTVAFDTEGQLSPQQLHSLNQVLQTIDLDSRNDEYEPAFVEVNGLLEIGRAVDDVELSEAVIEYLTTPQPKPQRYGEGRPMELEIEYAGLLDTFYFTEDKDYHKPLAKDEVEIHVEACGLTFKDCLTALGKLEGTTFGLECAGTVTRIGEHSDFVTGDRVCGVGSNVYKTYARLNRHCVLKMPDSMSFTDGASFPIGFLTVYHAFELARIKKGETILIHSAAGGTGQVAIQVSRYFGVAEIFVTVSSNEKKRVLMKMYDIPEDHIFSNRDTLFSESIKRMTRHGVDLVLNSLSGEGLSASWDCIAPYGRFIELGKRDIISNSQLSMLPFLKNVSYIGFDLSDWIRDRPEQLANALQALMKLIASGQLHIARPLQVYQVSEIEKAFRHLQSGQSFGKIVVEMSKSALVPVAVHSRPSYRFPPNETFLIAGGLGGLGRSIARWMVDRGARHMILLSRSGLQGDTAMTLVKELEAQGAIVKCPVCDVADFSALQSVLTQFSTSMPPIKGCIQASMVLRDSLFENMSYDDWRAGIDPKVAGSWNLHKILPSGLDFFILLSSVCGILGQIGQSNYAAGNTFQDALARYRVRHGENATSLDLGAMISEGYLTENEKVSKRLLSSGYFAPVSQEDLFAVLQQYCDPSTRERRVLNPLKSQSIIGLTRPSTMPPSEVKRASRLSSPLFRHMHHPSSSTSTSPSPQSSTTTTTTSKTSSLLQRFINASTNAEASTIVCGALMQKLSLGLPGINNNINNNKVTTTGTGVGTVDMWKPMLSYGVDSLVAVELRNWFAREFAAEVPVFETMGGASFESVGRAVAERSGFRKIREGGGNKGGEGEGDGERG